MIPHSLAQVAAVTADGGSLSFALRNFLDAFYAAPSSAALADVPAALHGTVPEGDVLDAYLAATAEELARERSLPQPPWVRRPERQLAHPWFALTWPGLRTILLLESPPAFRSRNLFVSANALSRA